ncbi:hypothetical protein [Lacrimispora brassicae]
MKEKVTFNLGFVNNVPRFMGRQMDMQAYPLDLLVFKNKNK